MTFRNASILIVEDELIVAQDLRNRLGLLGYRVVGSAASGADAIALADELRPDLVLMDIQLEGAMDGVAAAERIHQDLLRPVVFLTAYSEDETLSRAAAVGPYGYVLKPVEDRELKPVLEMALHKHRADREIRRLQRLYAMLSQVNQTIVRIRSREELFPAIARLAVEFGQFKAARLDAWDPGRASLTLLEQAGVELGPPSRPPSGGSTDSWPHRAARDAAATGRTVVCHDVRGGAPSEAERAWAARSRVRSLACVPFRFQGDVAGVLTLGDGECGFFQGPEVRLVEETALDVSFALDQFEAAAQRARAEAALAQRVEELAALNGLGRAVGSSQTLAETTRAALAGILQAVRPDLGFLFLRDGERLTLQELPAPSGPARLGAFQEHRLGERLAGLAMRQGRPLYARDVSQDDRRTWDDCQQLGLRSLAALPLVSGEAVIGALGLASAAERDFGRQESFLETLASQVSGALGQAVLFEAAQRELAERRRTEAALRRSEKLLALVFNSSRDLQLLVAVGAGDDLRVAAANRQYLETTRRFGYPVVGEELAGRRIDDLFRTTFSIPRELSDRALQRYREVATSGSPMFYEEDLETPGGHYFGEISLLPVLDDTGACAYVLYCARDITDQKREEAERAQLQAQLHQARKMESVGRLAGGVAHDFNNMLQSILGNTALAIEALPAGSPLRENLDEIQKSAEHSADLTRQLLTFARKQLISPRVLDLNDTVAGLLRMVRRLIGEGLDLAWRPGAAVWPIRMDPGQVDQILVNLCVNARDALGGSGTVTIATGNVTLDAAFARSHPGCVPGDHARLTVSDTGAGMSAETRAHLFEPFFTTKEVGKGTGLGLATVFGIVTQNRGVIDVQSEPARGTTFEIFIPRAEAGAGDPKAPEVRRSPGGSETVLLVEDEEQVLALSRRVLEKLGYKVLSASTPAAALERVTGCGEPIHLLVTDVVMPGMNGKELRDRLRVLHPGLKCLFMSGYTADVVANHGVLDRGVVFLEKPFTLQALAEKVREALA
jgi:C4-dicarboxylate-specific signal transduction histidine kinase/DNA-binding response OmpR family regulator